MILSHGRKYIFVHIPKTGGTSLALALESKAMKDDVMLGDTPKAKKRRNRVKDVKTTGRLWKHSKLSDIYGLVDQAQVEDYFVFTLVRNPWDRMVSYYHWLREQMFDHPHVALAKRLEFSPFLNDPMTQAVMGADGATRYVSDRDGVDRCDLYLRLEHLVQDVAVLEEALEMRLGVLPHANRSTRGAYQAYYSDADAALIERLFTPDITRFGYAFDG